MTRPSRDRPQQARSAVRSLVVDRGKFVECRAVVARGIDTDATQLQCRHCGVTGQVTVLALTLAPGDVSRCSPTSSIVRWRVQLGYCPELWFVGPGAAGVVTSAPADDDPRRLVM